LGDDVKLYSTIRITAVPPGEAPLWVREKWVGLELPAVGYSAPKGFFAYRVLSSPHSMLAQWWGVVRGRAERISGYAVEAGSAIDVLATSSPEAAAWWRENAPHVIGPRRQLLFPEHVCRIV
jgi:hypothetical protein